MGGDFFQRSARDQNTGEHDVEFLFRAVEGVAAGIVGNRVVDHGALCILVSQGDGLAMLIQRGVHAPVTGVGVQAANGVLVGHVWPLFDGVAHVPEGGVDHAVVLGVGNAGEVRTLCLDVSEHGSPRGCSVCVHVSGIDGTDERTLEDVRRLEFTGANVAAAVECEVTVGGVAQECTAQGGLILAGNTERADTRAHAANESRQHGEPVSTEDSIVQSVCIVTLMCFTRGRVSAGNRVAQCAHARPVNSFQHRDAFTLRRCVVEECEGAFVTLTLCSDLARIDSAFGKLSQSRICDACALVDGCGQCREIRKCDGAHDVYSLSE